MSSQNLPKYVDYIGKALSAASFVKAIAKIADLYHMRWLFVSTRFRY